MRCGCSYLVDDARVQAGGSRVDAPNQLPRRAGRGPGGEERLKVKVKVTLLADQWAT